MQKKYNRIKKLKNQNKKREIKKKKKENSPDLPKSNAEAEVYNNNKCD